jgi:hypothetical protein
VSIAPLILGAPERAAIERVKELAAARVKSFAEIEAVRTRGYIVPGENNEFTIAIPMGYRVTFTHEELFQGCVCRHISVSVDALGMLPSVESVELLLAAYGFVNGVKGCYVFIEDYGTYRGQEMAKAINLVEPLDGDVAGLLNRLTQ